MIEINLFPWREQRLREARRRQGLEVLLSLGLSFLLWLLLHWGLACQVERAQEKLLQLQSRLASVKKKWEEVRVIYQALDYQKIPNMELSALLSQQQRVLDFLEKMAAWRPSAITLSQVRFEKNIWNIEGMSYGINPILHYSEQLGLAFKKANAMDIQQKEGLFYFQLRIEAPA